MDKNTRRRARYASDPEYRAVKLAEKVRYYQRNRVSIRAAYRVRYLANPTPYIEAAKRVYYRDPAKAKARNKKRQLVVNYGLSEEQWNDLFDAQGRTCAICKTEKSGGKSWHTDHDHKTGRVRGILCFRCNVNLGIFERLLVDEATQRYLECLP